MEKAYITKDSTCCFASLDWACTGPRRCFDGHSTWYLTPSPGHKLLPHCQPWILVSVAETQLGSRATGFSKSASSISEVAQQAGLALGLAGLALGGALGDWTLDRACLSRDKASIWGHPSLFAQRGWPFSWFCWLFLRGMHISRQDTDLVSHAKSTFDQKKMRRSSWSPGPLASQICPARMNLLFWGCMYTICFVLIILQSHIIVLQVACIFIYHTLYLQYIGVYK